jgi:glutamine amidotransferase
MITIVDYGMGNLGSVQNMFKRIGVKSNITANPEEILKAEKIVLPGVGAFDSAVERIDQLNLRIILEQKAQIEKIPFLGICLGMQLLTKSSEEGVLPGLNFIDARTIKFKFENHDLKVPHMGWNQIYIKNNSSLISDFNNDFRFYFVHSYFVRCTNEKHVLTQTLFGDYFDSIIQNDNIFGSQFHPEKSHKYGMKLFENFAKI